MKRLRLKPHEERRLLKGHLWIFSNEVDTEKTPLKSFSPEELAIVETARGKPLGIAYINPHALICGRLLTTDPHRSIDTEFWFERLRRALRWREQRFEKPYYRWVHGEGDLLPGLILDRHGEVVVAQFNTAGIERAREALLEAIERLLRPKAIVLRNDTSARLLEGLEQNVEVLGQLPESVVVEESGCRFLIDPVHGQKTGWFYDHRLNRRFVAKIASGKRVLDLFCYVGAWGVLAARRGAKHVIAVDSSARALELARENAKLNGVAERITFIESEAFEFLRRWRESFELIALDQPAFIKRRRDLEVGQEGYRRLNRLALKRLAGEGVLISCSCSQRISAETFQRLVYQVGRGQGLELRKVYRGGQGPDHPIHLAIPETDYLKAFGFVQ